MGNNSSMGHIFKEVVYAMGIGPHGNTVSIYEEQIRSYLQKSENLYWPLCLHLQAGPQLQLFNFPICIMESHAALAVITSCLHSTGNNQLNYKMKIILHPMIMHQELKAEGSGNITTKL